MLFGSFDLCVTCAMFDCDYVHVRCHRSSAFRVSPFDLSRSCENSLCRRLINVGVFSIARLCLNSTSDAGLEKPALGAQPLSHITNHHRSHKYTIHNRSKCRPCISLLRFKFLRLREKKEGGGGISQGGDASDDRATLSNCATSFMRSR